MTTIVSAYQWVAAHPVETVQYLLALWAVANVVWAQWPKPKSERAQAVWVWLHNIFQLIATTASAKGTFTWPYLLRVLMTSSLNSPAPDPFGSTGAKEPDDANRAKLTDRPTDPGSAKGDDNAS